MRRCTTMAAQQFCAVLSILLFSPTHTMLVPLRFYKKITWLSFPPALCFVLYKQPMHPALSFDVSQSKKEQIPSPPLQHVTVARPGQSLRNSSRAPTPMLLVAKKGRSLLPAAVVMPNNRQVYSKALQNASCRMVKMMEVMPAKKRLCIQTSSCRLSLLCAGPGDLPKGLATSTGAEQAATAGNQSALPQGWRHLAFSPSPALPMMINDW